MRFTVFFRCSVVSEVVNKQLEVVFHRTANTNLVAPPPKKNPGAFTLNTFQKGGESPLMLGCVHAFVWLGCRGNCTCASWVFLGTENAVNAPENRFW